MNVRLPTRNAIQRDPEDFLLNVRAGPLHLIRRRRTKKCPRRFGNGAELADDDLGPP